MEVRKELYKLSQDVEAKEKGMKEGKTRAERAKTFLKTYSDFIDGLVNLLKTYQDRVKKEIEEGTKESKDIVAKINSLSEEIVLTNREWEKFKTQFSVFKVYEGKISNRLCDLAISSKLNCLNGDLKSQRENL
ncbi:hypothetical protein MHLP_03280 [Candidatus Mycoplasma haematolamae str. Purdue]|uniref:Uncharacterized protein n=1 Tax=Mycoplasma haematolamae (strain Purdue) TaxID=1212765 RepID=I7CG62_MYCHA|nr:hypothetical protein MHLP_03280 [Candidatus Mycoplasma haematolamae str. Purdue]